MTKPLQIGRFAFARKMDAEAHIKKIFKEAVWGEPLAGEEHEFVLSLLLRHPRAQEKLSGGLSHFTVNSNGYGYHCFYIHRPIGPAEHFSYIKSLRGEDDVRSLVLSALNRAIDDQIWTFRDTELAKGEQYCPYTKLLITKDHYHVDHPDPTFLELHTGWLQQTGLKFEQIKISDGSGNEIGRHMTDDDQRTSWQNYHRTYARLRLLSPRGNLSEAKIEANARIRNQKAGT